MKSIRLEKIRQICWVLSALLLVPALIVTAHVVHAQFDTGGDSDTSASDGILTTSDNDPAAADTVTTKVSDTTDTVEPADVATSGILSDASGAADDSAAETSNDGVLSGDDATVLPADNADVATGGVLTPDPNAEDASTLAKGSVFVVNESVQGESLDTATGGTLTSDEKNLAALFPNEEVAPVRHKKRHAATGGVLSAEPSAPKHIFKWPAAPKIVVPRIVVDAEKPPKKASPTPAPVVKIQASARADASADTESPKTIPAQKKKIATEEKEKEEEKEDEAAAPKSKPAWVHYGVDCTLRFGKNAFGQTTLVWHAINATRGYIAPGVGSVSPVSGGATTITPTIGQQYVFTAHGPGGAARCETAPYEAAAEAPAASTSSDEMPVAKQLPVRSDASAVAYAQAAVPQTQTKVVAARPTPSVSLSQVPYTGVDDDNLIRPLIAFLALAGIATAVCGVIYVFYRVDSRYDA